jgi:type I restriction-modification system DNA methylase subunit
LIDTRFAELLKAHRYKEADLDADTPSTSLARYWRACLEYLKIIKICDPACGSGAFLIEAFDLLEEKYASVVENLAFHEQTAERPFLDVIADDILSLNLYGVDLSEQGVEITQLALWLRSAKRNKTLADLSRNIVWGNSLVTDPAISDKAMVWREKFADVFNRPAGGFDCVIGNPPWERIKLQEREFFAHSAPKIAGAVSAAQRRKLIETLQT